MRLPLQDAARLLDCPIPLAAGLFTGSSIDSRTLRPGDLFFALGGASRDGHDFVAAAFEKGAAAAVVEREVTARGPLLLVESVQQALEKVAAWARRRWAGKVVAITGSTGKTTTKEAAAALLDAVMPTGKSSGNYNNHLGVPLSILNLPDHAAVAVLEMGMNHGGEIRRLASVAAPDIGVVTNVGLAHAENFDSIEDIARAKRELIESLPPDGVAVLNADSETVRRFAEGHPGRTVFFGIRRQADVQAEGITLAATGSRFTVGGVEFETSLLGRHNIMNILAGMAVARGFQIPLAVMREPVRRLEPGRMRGEQILRNGAVIWDDCYNSNPEAVKSMLDLMRDTAAGRRIAVLGEMLELGRLAEDLHRDVGSYAAASGLDVLIGISGAASHVVSAARDAGMTGSAAFFCSQPEEAGERLRAIARAGDLILFKGSRGTQVEKALQRFLSPG